jgi:hypothetical protein
MNIIPIRQATKNNYHKHKSLQEDNTCKDRNSKHIKNKVKQIVPALRRELL